MTLPRGSHTRGMAAPLALHLGPMLRMAVPSMLRRAICGDSPNIPPQTDLLATTKGGGSFPHSTHYRREGKKRKATFLP